MFEALKNSDDIDKLAEKIVYVQDRDIVLEALKLDMDLMILDITAATFRNTTDMIRYRIREPIFVCVVARQGIAKPFQFNLSDYDVENFFAPFIKLPIIKFKNDTVVNFNLFMKDYMAEDDGMKNDLTFYGKAERSDYHFMYIEIFAVFGRMPKMCEGVTMWGGAIMREIIKKMLTDIFLVLFWFSICSMVVTADEVMRNINVLFINVHIHIIL